MECNSLNKLPLIKEREDRLVALDVAIARGLNDAEAGRVSPAEDVFLRLEAKYSCGVGKGARRTNDPRG